MDSEEHNRFVTKLSPPFGDLALNSDLFSIEFARLIGWYRQNDLNMRSRSPLRHFFLTVLSQDIIRVVFQRGEFTESATSDVASVFAILMIGLLTGPTSIVYSRALYAAQKTMWINVVKVLTGLWGMLLSIALFRSFQLTGLAVAAASMTTVELIIIYCQLLSGAKVNFIPSILLLYSIWQPNLD